MKENRHFRIIYLILQKGRVTAPELAEKLEVSVRTIYRDINALSGAGVPICVTTGRNGGVRILDTFILSKALFSDSEKQALLTALQNLSAMTGAAQESLLSKLSALFRTQPESWLEIDFARWGNEPSDNAKFERIKTAVIERKTLTIVYAGSSGERRTRKIEPLKLSYKAKDWYLKARDAESGAFRLFKLNRILSYAVLDGKFEPTEYPAEPAGLPERCEPVRLRFPKETAYRVYDEFSNDQVRETETGELIVTAVLPVDDWLVGYLLSFGASVDVIEPKSLRRVLAREAAKILKKNKP